MKTTVKGLTSYQMKQIVFIATTDQYSEKERVELLRSLSYCTDTVKFEALKSSEQISEKQYDRLCDLYFLGNVKKQWTYKKTVRLIECYNSGISNKEMAEMFGTSKAAIRCRICYIRSNPIFTAMFTLKKYTRRATRRAEVKA